MSRMQVLRDTCPPAARLREGNAARLREGNAARLREGNPARRRG
jgi:hypothetical protein